MNTDDQERFYAVMRERDAALVENARLKARCLEHREILRELVRYYDWAVSEDAAPGPNHYPPGMGEESRRLHREYNRLVAAQAAGAHNGADVVRLTDEAAAKGIILVPGGESL